jgi:SAM-dependent methyltransferase
MTVEECVSCGLAFLNPRPREWDIPKLYGEDYFQAREKAGEHITPVYGPCSRIEFLELLALIRQRVALKGKRLLDVGCGTGMFAAMAMEAGADVTGVEISEYAAEEARRRHGVTVRVGRIEKLRLERESFDVATLLETLECTTSPKTVLMHVAYAMRPGGLALILTPNYGVGRHLGSAWAMFDSSFERLYYFDYERIARLMEYCGLRPVGAVSFRHDALGLLSKHSRTVARLLGRAGKTVGRMPFVNTIARGVYRRAREAVSGKSGRALNGHKLVVLGIKEKLYE